jgi:hypothetical protein
MAFKLEPESIKEYLRRQMKYLRNDMNYSGYQEDTTFDLIRL